MLRLYNGTFCTWTYTYIHKKSSWHNNWTQIIIQNVVHMSIWDRKKFSQTKHIFHPWKNQKKKKKIVAFGASRILKYLRRIDYTKKNLLFGELIATRLWSDHISLKLAMVRLSMSMTFLAWSWRTPPKQHVVSIRWWHLSHNKNEYGLMREKFPGGVILHTELRSKYLETSMGKTAEVSKVKMIIKLDLDGDTSLL